MIDHQSSIPLYQQIADTLKGNIHSGVYGEGDRLPSEKRLSEQYDVSRITVRQAMNALLAEVRTAPACGSACLSKNISCFDRMRRYQRRVRFSLHVLEREPFTQRETERGEREMGGSLTNP